MTTQKLSLAPFPRMSEERVALRPQISSTTSPRPSKSFSQIVYSPLKRVIDLVGAVVLLVVFTPFMLLIALFVRLSSPGPIIFAQRRLTDGGREFVMYKFRTMRQDAESKTGAVWARHRDPRVTFFGRILRKTHTDELPQLVNVIRGDMSLIGPRPERPEMLSKLTAEFPSFHRRHEVRAGITGLAQTSNGYASSIETYRRKLAWDIVYVKNRCLWLDVRIALRTLFVIFKGGSAA